MSSRYSLLIEGKAEDFLSKISGRKRSLLVSAIVNDALKNKRVSNLMTNFFSKTEIENLLDKKFEEKTSSEKKPKEQKKEFKDKVFETEDKSDSDVKNTFKVEL